MATAKAWRHLGLKPRPGAGGLFADDPRERDPAADASGG
jgi:hypothetical protein